MRALNKAIEDSRQYDDKKLAEIFNLTNILESTAATNQKARYDINLRLFEAYKYYNYDSAFSYTKHLRRYAEEQRDATLIADARIKQVFILLSGGLFKETFDSLNTLNISGVLGPVRADYYSLKGRCYYDLADFDDDGLRTASYYAKANACMDSALALYPPASFDHSYYSGLQNLKEGRSDKALSQLLALIQSKNLSFHEVALITSTLGGIFTSLNQPATARDYFVRASIADIKSSTKETSALLSVATMIFKQGNVKDAALYIEKANEDASFYKARLRKVQIGAILPLIKEQLIKTVETQKQQLVTYLWLMVLLVLLLAGVTLIVRQQVKKLKVAKDSLLQSNLKQQEINAQLTEANLVKERYNEQVKEINRQLLEANKIKEEYLGYYFSIDTEFMARMEKLVNNIEKKLGDRRWEEIKLLLRSVDFKKEKEELLVNFDTTFLRLFPDFVTQFNLLFKPEDRFMLKKDQLLNTELRIFALIRMGITENEKIAEILNYSINTIYSYKTKMRNKAIIPKDEFDRKITQITTLRYDAPTSKADNPTI